MKWGPESPKKSEALIKDVKRRANYKGDNLLQLLEHFGPLNSFLQQINTEEIQLVEISQNQMS